MKKVLAMSILTMIVMSMGGCGASSDSSSSQDVSSKAETESNSPYTVEADFSKGASMIFHFSRLVNGDPFNCSWSEDNVTFNDGKCSLPLTVWAIPKRTEAASIVQKRTMAMDFMRFQ